MGRNLERWDVYYANIPAYLKHADMDRLKKICKQRNTPVSTLMRTVLLAFVDACEAGENLTDRHLALLTHVLPRADSKIDIECTAPSGSPPTMTSIPIEPASEAEAEEIQAAIVKMTEALNKIAPPLPAKPWSIAHAPKEKPDAETP